MEPPLAQILVVVANNRMRSWRTEVEKGFVWTVVDHELVGPKFKVKAENFQVTYIYNKNFIILYTW